MKEMVHIRWWKYLICSWISRKILLKWTYYQKWYTNSVQFTSKF
jgi:hypothetical protein